jgi:hypothetical protein
MMNKAGLIVLALLAIAGLAYAGMDDKKFETTVVGVETGSVSYVIRGELEGIYIDVQTPTVTTQTVTFATGQQTLLTKDFSADTWVPLKFAQYGSTGEALTFNTYYATSDVAVANAQTWYDKAPLAGTVTMTVIGKNNASSTNKTTATLIYSK